MSQLRALDDQIKSLHTLDKVIETKKHVATSLWQSASLQSKHAKFFYDHLVGIVAKKLRTTPAECIPAGLTSLPSGGKSFGIVFGGDESWCGGFNYQIVAQSKTKAVDKMYVFGKKVAEDIDGEYVGELSTTRTEFLKFATQIMEMVARGEVSSVSVLYAQDRWMGWEEVLPLVDTQGQGAIDDSDNDLSHAPALILSAMLCRACSSTQAQETFERILATDESSKNCSQMMNELNIARNKERQKIITGQIIEIVSGYMV